MIYARLGELADIPPAEDRTAGLWGRNNAGEVRLGTAAASRQTNIR